MTTESSQKWLERNRPPRVQISYDVETGGASAKRELPMVVGILADLGATDEPMPKRRFIEIDRDNFNQIMKTIAPSMAISGINGLSGSVKFEKLEDFEPDQLVRNVDGLKELFEQRKNLRDLMAKIDGNDLLHKSLVDAVKADPRFEGWGVKLAQPAASGDSDPAKLSAEQIAALTPDQLVAFSDEQLGALSAEQLAGLTPEQVKALGERKPFSAAQIEHLSDELKSLLTPKA